MPRFSIMPLAGIMGLAVALPAPAQFYGGANNYAPANNQAYSRGLSGSGDPGGNLRSFSIGGNGGFFGGGGGGGSSYGATTPWSQKYGSYVTNASSGWLRNEIAERQSATSSVMANQDIKLRAYQLKQAAFDEMMYEKMNTPPPELVREEQRVSRLTRARNTPPDSEIYTGLALNELLVNVQRIEAREGVRGYMIPLDPETVKHLNVTTTDDTRGSNEMFKTDASQEWPAAFTTPSFLEDRTRVMRDIALMVKAQQMGRLDIKASSDARKAVTELKSTLFSARFDLSFTDYSDALGFLNKLNDTVQLLGKPGAKNFVDGTYSAKGSSVGELLDYMTSKGLRFAPATSGYEPYYLGFYQQMVTYDIGLGRLVGDQSTVMYQGPPKR